MTAPYPYYKNCYYMLTRRVKDGEYRLKPTRKIRRIFLYLLFYYAKRHGIEILAATLMSNHYHLVVRDIHGRLGCFLRDFHARMFHALSELEGRYDLLWEPGRKPGRTRALDSDAVWRKLLYTVLNPVRANIEEHASDWVGTLVTPRDIGRTVSVPRPDLLACADLPPIASHRVGRPPGCAESSDRRVAKKFLHEVKLREDALAEGRETAIETSAKALKRPSSTRPTAPLPRTPNPEFATFNKALMKAAREQLRRFRTAYRAALDQLRDGVRDVLFPPGTYALHHFHNLPRANE